MNIKLVITTLDGYGKYPLSFKETNIEIIKKANKLPRNPAKRIWLRYPEDKKLYEEYILLQRYINSFFTDKVYTEDDLYHKINNASYLHEYIPILTSKLLPDNALIDIWVKFLTTEIFVEYRCDDEKDESNYYNFGNYEVKSSPDDIAQNILSDLAYITLQKYNINILYDIFIKWSTWNRNLICPIIKCFKLPSIILNKLACIDPYQIDNVFTNIFKYQVNISHALIKKYIDEISCDVISHVFENVNKKTFSNKKRVGEIIIKKHRSLIREYIMNDWIGSWGISEYKDDIPKDMWNYISKTYKFSVMELDIVIPYINWKIYISK